MFLMVINDLSPLHGLNLLPDKQKSRPNCLILGHIVPPCWVLTPCNITMSSDPTPYDIEFPAKFSEKINEHVLDSL